MRCFVLLFLCSSTLFSSSLLARESLVEKATLSYEQALSAKTHRDQEEKLREALLFYNALSREERASVLLEAAATAKALGEYGYTLYYYREAIRTAPRNDTIKQAYNRVALFAKVPLFQESAWYTPSRYLSKEEGLYLLLSALLLSIFSLFLSKICKRAALLLLFFALFFFVSLQELFTPEKGLFIRTGTLQKAADSFAPTLHSNRVKAGEPFELIQVIEAGSWLEVRLSDGKIGYAAKEQLRLF